MFEINNRRTLLDIVAPPPDYVFDRGIATTYSLSLYAAMCVLLAAQGYDPDSDKERGLEAVRSITKIINKGNLIIFCNKGPISCSRRSGLMKLLDNLVSDIRLEEGSFHPKVWILKYKPSAEATAGKKNIYKLICTSKNLTDSGYLEISYAAEGISAGRRGDDRNTSLRAFLNGVLLHANPKKFNVSVYRCFIDELRSVKFDGGPFDFYYQSGSKSGDEFKKNTLNLKASRKIIIISPFVNMGFLKDISRKNDATLISTRSALDLLDKEALKNISEIFVSADNIDLDEAKEDGVKDRVALHAKVYIMPNHDKCDIWLGSANATGQGWSGKNAEAMVRVTVPYSIDKFEREFIYKDKDKNKLHGYLTRYESPPTKKEDKERVFNDLVSYVAACDFRINYDKSRKRAAVSVTSPNILQRYLLKYANENDAVIKISVGLYDMKDRRDISEFFKKKKVMFNEVALSDISEFMEISVSVGALKRTTVTIIAQSNLYDYKNERVETALKDALSSPQRVKDYIRHVLLEDKAAFYDSFKYTKEPGGGGFVHDAEDRTLDLFMEDILLNYDNEKIDEIDFFLKRIPKKNIEPKFMDFWARFRKVVRKK